MSTDVIDVPTEETALTIIETPAQLAALVPPSSASTSLAVDPYVGVAAVPFDEKAQSVLEKYQDVPDEWIDVKPDGKLYLSHIKARNILNEAFGFGGWALVPVGDYNVSRAPFKDKYGKDAEHVTVYRTFRLYVNGRFQDEAMGAGSYYSNNKEADYSDACEAAKSYALNRLCKTFNIAQKCWDKDFGRNWLAQYAQQDDSGKWKKRKQALGAASLPSTGAATVQNTHTQPEREKPTESHAPASGAAPKNLRDIIQVAERKPNSKGKLEWTFSGTRNSMFKDTEGRSWKFLNDAIDVAVASGGAPIAIEYVKEKTTQGTVSAVVSAALIGEGGQQQP
jgi:hypothetical protein